MTIEDQGRSGLGASFNLLWLGQAVSQVGDYIAYFTVPAFVSLLTSRATDFGIVFAAENLPTLLFGFSAGVVLDRVSLKSAAIVTDIGRAIAFAALAIVAASNPPSVWVIFLFAFTVGTLAAGFNAALPSFVPAIVSKEHVASANARLSFTQQASFVVAPALGGAIVAAWGFTTAFWINASTFAISAVSLAFVRAQRERVVPTQQGRFVDELKEGLSYLWNHAALRYATLAGAVTNLVLAFIESMLILLGKEVFGIEDFAQLGLVFGAMGVGGVVGALTATRLIDWLGLGRTVVVGMALIGAGLLGMAFQTTLIGVAVLLGFAPAGLAWINISIITMRQTMTPERLLGRVTAASRSIAWGTLPIGALVSGVLADAVFGLEVLTFVAPVVVLVAAFTMSRTALWSGAIGTDEFDDPGV